MSWAWKALVSHQRRSFIVVTVLVASASGAWAREPVTIYVSPDGRDGGPGSAGVPLATLQAAADRAKPGDTVVARAGLYGGFVMGWDDPQGGSADAPITFRGEGAIVTRRNGKTPDGIDLENGSDWITITGFTVNNAARSITRAGIRVAGSDHVSVLRNTCLGNGTWGIFSSHSDDLTIVGNIAAGSKKQHGIYVSNSSARILIRGNVIYENAQCGIHLNGDQSQGGGDGMIRDATIELNVIHDNGLRGGSAINGDGLTQSVIRNNVLYANHANGISLFREDAAAGASDNRVEHNTVLMADDSRWALNIKDGSTHVTVLNNILFNAHPSHGSIEIKADSMEGLVSDQNLLGPRFSVEEDQTVDVVAWRAATKQDVHSTVTDAGAVFVDAGHGDFHLRPGEPDAGAALPGVR